MTVLEIRKRKEQRQKVWRVPQPYFMKQKKYSSATALPPLYSSLSTTRKQPNFTNHHPPGSSSSSYSSNREIIDGPNTNGSATTPTTTTIINNKTVVNLIKQDDDDCVGTGYNNYNNSVALIQQQQENNGSWTSETTTLNENNNNNTKLEIHTATYKIIKVVVEELLFKRNGIGINIRDLANSLIASSHILNSYASEWKPRSPIVTTETTVPIVQNGMGSSSSSSKKPILSLFHIAQKMKQQMNASTTTSARKWSRWNMFYNKQNNISNRMNMQTKRRYEWIHAMNKLQEIPYAKDELIYTWEDAFRALTMVLLFPVVDDDDDENNNNNTTTMIGNNTNNNTNDFEMNSYIKRLNDIHLNVVKNEISTTDMIMIRRPSEHIWQSVFANASVSIESANEIRKEIQLEKEQQEQQYQQQIKLEIQKEALEKAAELMKPLTPDEITIVRNELYNKNGSPTDVIAQIGSGDVLVRASFQRLLPGQWLNDEVIHYYLLLLQKRNEDYCVATNNNNKRCHFFKSFFITKLRNEGHPTLDGQYEYKNVKRWSKNVYGKDIFGLDKIIFPINMGNMHWVCACIFIKERTIQFYDSLGNDGMEYIHDLFQYIQDEHFDKKKQSLPNVDEWKLIPCTNDTPKQLNGYDCGVFACMFCDFISKDCPIQYITQEHITQCRQRIALSILQGSAL